MSDPCSFINSLCSIFLMHIFIFFCVCLIFFTVFIIYHSAFIVIPFKPIQEYKSNLHQFFFWTAFNMNHFHFCSVDAFIPNHSQSRAAESVKESGHNIVRTRSMEDRSLLCAWGLEDVHKWHLVVAFYCCWSPFSCCSSASSIAVDFSGDSDRGENLFRESNVLGIFIQLDQSQIRVCTRKWSSHRKNSTVPQSWYHST